MKLIGGHDFYDGAGYGVDETIVFLRDRKMRLSDVEALDGHQHPFHHPAPWEFNEDRDGVSGSLCPFLVVVAGKIYPGLEEVNRYWGRHGHRPDTHIFHYNLDDALSVYDTYCDRTRAFTYDSIYGFDSRADRRERLKSFFATTITREQTDWLIDNKVTVLSSFYEPYHSRKGIQIRLNHACLKDLQFYKKLDPFTTHMEIQSWLSGVLPFNKDVVDISDRDKIRKAGFDVKTSFRKPPGKRAKSA